MIPILPTVPLAVRCLTLTGALETSQMPPECFSALAGDFDGMGLSFSCLQWNFGQQTLQPLLKQMFTEHPAAMTFPSPDLETILDTGLVDQMNWVRSIQSKHVIDPAWSAAFRRLGATPEWQSVAVASAARYWQKAQNMCAAYRLTSDRAAALLFDIEVQNGGISISAANHLTAIFGSPATDSWSEPQKLQIIANCVADSAKPQFAEDVRTRKITIANGTGLVHGMSLNLANFGIA